MARPKKDDDERRTSAINVRTTDEMGDEFRAAVDVLGTKMSDELHRHVVEVIRRAKTLDREKFEERLKVYQAKRKKGTSKKSTR